MKRRERLRRRSELPSGRAKTIDGSNKRITRWILPALFLFSILPYLQTWGHEFVNFDDKTYVLENALVQRGLTWSNLAWAFTTTFGGNWHPLTWLSHMLDCQLFGLRPGWHHLTSVLLHGMNTVMLFVVLRAMTGAVWRSALVAALFAVHPLHVESVAWIAERKDVLSTFFGLWAIWAYVKYVRAPSLIRYGAVACFFLLSLLSKPMLVTLPCVLLLLDFWPLKRVWRESGVRNPPFASLFLEKLPLLAISVAMSLITFRAQHTAGAVAPIDLLPLSQRLANAMVAYVGYLGKTFWPVNLAAIYPIPEQTSVMKSALAVLILASITIVVALSARKRPWLLVGWLWFVGTLVPVIGFVQVGDQAMADRYTYVPLIGVFIMIAWSLSTSALPAINRGRVAMMTGIIAVVLAALTTVTFAQVQVWKNTRTLFDHAIKVTDGNFTAHNLLAGAVEQEGDFIGARANIEESLRIRPNYAGARYNLGLILMRENNFVRAQEQFKLALQNSPLDPLIWNALGAAAINLGQTDEAIQSYQRALQLDPNYVSALVNLGGAFLAQGKFAEAIEASEKALQLRPNIAEAQGTLGAAMWKMGRTDESISHNRKALELNPGLLDPQLNLGAALLAKGNYAEAIALMENLLRQDPQNKVAQEILAACREKITGR